MHYSSQPCHRYGLRGKGVGFKNSKIIHFLFDFYIFLEIAEHIWRLFVVDRRSNATTYFDQHRIDRCASPPPQDTI